MAPATLALVFELSRKWFWPFFGKMHSLHNTVLMNAAEVLEQRKPILNLLHSILKTVGNCLHFATIRNNGDSPCCLLWDRSFHSLMLPYTLEEIPITMPGAVSLIAVIERNAKNSSLQSSIDTPWMWSTDKEKLVYWYLLLNGQEAWDFYRVFIEATCLISWQSDTGPSVYDYGLDAVIIRITTWKEGAELSSVFKE